MVEMRLSVPPVAVEGRTTWLEAASNPWAPTAELPLLEALGGLLDDPSHAATRATMTVATAMSSRRGREGEAFSRSGISDTSLTGTSTQRDRWRTSCQSNYGAEHPPGRGTQLRTKARGPLRPVGASAERP